MEYLNLYEDRYRRLREQGIEDWVADPLEMAQIIKSVDDFLNYAGCHPTKTSIIEFGCGQGHLAIHLIDNGYRYRGVDISESAIMQAQKKAGTRGQNAFLVADVTNLHQLPGKSFDIAIDNQCFHMLVTDEHRKKYLAEVKRILISGGKAYFRDMMQKDEFTKKIADFQEFVETCYGDYSELHEYPAYYEGKQSIIRLPRVPARYNNEQGYRKELEAAGFSIDSLHIVKTQCIIYTHIR